jgi:hypothetical protein
MVAWSTLAAEVATTEFPEFELLACFQVFKLTEPLPSPSTARVYLERLVQAFQVPLGTGGIECLVDQFLEHQKLALGLKVAGEPAAMSWQRAVQKTQHDSRRRTTFPCDELGPLLCRFVVSPGSTAGIEQNFSAFKRVLGEHTCASELGEERRLVLHLACCTMPGASETLLARARLIWANSFGAPRASNTGTLRGFKTAKPDGSTCTSWLRRRRDQVHKSMATPIVDEAVQAAGSAAWTAKHEAELNFQKGVRLEHHCAAVQHGVANEESLGPDAAEKIDAYRRSLLKREHNLLQKGALADKKRTDPVMPKLRGLSVYADGEASPILAKTHKKWMLSLQRFQLKPTQDRTVASVFAVLNPSEPGDRVKVIAAMVGGFICTPEFLLGETSSSVGLKLQRALQWPRHIFISDRCYAKHHGFVDMMQHVCAQQKGCRWTWYMESEGDDRKTLFLERARKRSKVHLVEMVTLVDKHEQLAGFPNQKLLTKFIVDVHKLDAGHTFLGFCGR